MYVIKLAPLNLPEENSDSFLVFTKKCRFGFAVYYSVHFAFALTISRTIYAVCFYILAHFLFNT